MRNLLSEKMNMEDHTIKPGNLDQRNQNDFYNPMITPTVPIYTSVPYFPQPENRSNFSAQLNGFQSLNENPASPWNRNDQTSSVNVLHPTTGIYHSNYNQANSLTYPSFGNKPNYQNEENNPRILNLVNSTNIFNQVNRPNIFIPVNGPSLPYQVNRPNVPYQVNRPNVPYQVNRPNVPYQVNRPNVPYPVNRPNIPILVIRPNFPNPVNIPNVPNPVNRPNNPNLVNRQNLPNQVNRPNLHNPVNRPNSINQLNKSSGPNQANKQNLTTHLLAKHNTSNQEKQSNPPKQANKPSIPVKRDERNPTNSTDGSRQINKSSIPSPVNKTNNHNQENKSNLSKVAANAYGLDQENKKKDDKTINVASGSGSSTKALTVTNDKPKEIGEPTNIDSGEKQKEPTKRKPGPRFPKMTEADYENPVRKREACYEEDITSSDGSKCVYCLICWQEFKSKAEWWKHFNKECSKENGNWLVCQRCPYKAKKKATILKHIYSHDPDGWW